MRLRFFGYLRDLVGDEADVDVPAGVADSEALRDWLACQWPVLRDPRIRMALDDRVLAERSLLDSVSEVAFLPPVSGG